MRQLKDKICVITGASSGIGAACARAMAAEGALVIGCDLRLDMLKDVAKQVKDAGGRMEAHSLDVSDRDAVFALAQKIEKKHGGADVVLNNAGAVSYTHLRAHETKANLVCRLLLEKKNY